jgi:hypothetical protein
MKQSDIVEAVVSGRARIAWVPLGPELEVMAWPARVEGAFVAVSARTAQACAAALNGEGWLVTLTTPKVEDMIYEAAALRPEPVLLNPQRLNIASEPAIREHSEKLLKRLGAASESALIVAGKSWVLSNGLSSRPGRAANYGLFSASAPYKSENGACKLWQPLSFVHNLDHFDYSQMLRLVRRRPGAQLPAYDAPLRVLPADSEPEPPVSSPPTVDAVAQGTLGERCLAWCLEEAAAHERPDADRIAWYHAVAIRNGKPLGIKSGNHCASAQSRALTECVLEGEVKPHSPRAAALELQSDAMASGRWRSVREVRAGKWLPRPGDLAIYDRSVPGKPTTSWQRHVDRVIRVSDRGDEFENIGANEAAGAWKREWTRFEHPKLLGFVEYPGIPTARTELEEAGVALDGAAVG